MTDVWLVCVFSMGTPICRKIEAIVNREQSDRINPSQANGNALLTPSRALPEIWECMRLAFPLGFLLIRRDRD